MTQEEQSEVHNLMVADGSMDCLTERLRNSVNDTVSQRYRDWFVSLSRTSWKNEKGDRQYGFEFSGRVDETQPV